MANQERTSRARILVPCIHGRVAFYSDKRFRAIKRRIKEKVGFEFKLKGFRSNPIQLTLYRNPNLLYDMIMQMGHSSEVNEERYYITSVITSPSGGPRRY